MKTSLLRQITAYSGLASSVLLSSGGAQSQILYTNPPDIVLDSAGDITYLDLNNDGEADFKVLIPFVHPLMHGIEFNKCSSCFAEVIAAGPHTCSTLSSRYVMVALPQGYFVGPNKHFHSSTYYDYFSQGSSCIPNLKGKTNRFIGVDLQLNETNYYGWIRVTVSKNSDKVKIKDWVINLTPNTSIQTGQKAILNEGGKKEAVFVAEDGDDLPLFSIYSFGKTIVIEQTENLPVQITIMNMMGQIVKTDKSSDTTYTLDNSELPAGIYLVQIHENNYAETKKVAMQ